MRLSPKKVFQEVLRAVEMSQNGSMTIASNLTRAVVSVYVEPLKLETDSRILSKWKELPFHRQILAGKRPFATPLTAPGVRLHADGSLRYTNAKTRSARETIQAKNTATADSFILLKPDETNEFKQDLLRWIETYEARTDIFAL